MSAWFDSAEIMSILVFYSIQRTPNDIRPNL